MCQKIVFAVAENGKMITDGDLRNVFEYMDKYFMDKYFSDYEGCRNCRHQPQPMQMCEWGKKRDHIELICSGWEKKE